VTLPAVRHNLTSLPARTLGRQDDSHNDWTYKTGSVHARYFRLDDLANQLAVYHRQDAQRLTFLTGLHTCDLLVLDDFLTTPIPGETAAELLNILAAREGRGSTVVTSQFDPEDWYRSLHDAVIAESILNRIVSSAELVKLDGPNMRRHTHAETTS